MITFLATRKKVEAKSTVSNDTEVVLTLVSDSREPLKLGLDEADTLYKITIDHE